MPLEALSLNVGGALHPDFRLMVIQTIAVENSFPSFLT